MQTEWNYSELAKSYLNRPDYAPTAIDKILEVTQVSASSPVCDVGAGVAHLTLPLLRRGLNVIAVEPNNAMRHYGQERTKDFSNVKWVEATGESTCQPTGTFDLVTFGSSFNVTDRQKALKEAHRILRNNGWFVCLWNHRDLSAPLQKAVEDVIQRNVEGYAYGSRREDQTQVIRDSGLFTEPVYFESTVVHSVRKKDWIDAWRSHATLQRQAKEKFHALIEEIEKTVDSINPNDTLSIPYTTVVWTAKKIS